MTQDFAKKRPRKESSRDSAPRKTQGRTFYLATFVTGFLGGAFITFLAALWYLKPAGDILVTTGGTLDRGTPKAESPAKAEEMHWTFYEIFPKSVVPVVQDYTNMGEKVVVDHSKWALQAGSFIDVLDADERRANLILLGLDASIRKVKVTGTTWHRVIVGPFDTQLARNRALDKLAQAEIPSLSMKIPAS